MKYNLVLRDKSQIQISQKDYDIISQYLSKVKLYKLEDGQIINAVDISRISPVKEQQVVDKEFRLTSPEETEERIEVLGGWQKPSARENMVRLFAKMKSNGAFANFKDYFEWEKAMHKV